VRLVLAAEALRRRSEYFQTVNRLWSWARRYWFDALVLAVLGIGLTGAVLGRGHEVGPEGPLWFDELALLAIVAPLFARRRFPFGAPVAVGVAAGATSFVDHTVVPFDGVTFIVGCAALFLVGSLRDRLQAVAGLAVAEGVLAVVVHNDPRSGVGNFVVATIIFTIIWTIAFASAGSPSRPTRRESGPQGRSANVRNARAVPSRRSARGSHASCMTSSVTVSA